MFEPTSACANAEHTYTNRSKKPDFARRDRLLIGQIARHATAARVILNLS